ncbi:MAG: cytochrome P460 family protein [Acidobacteria bacterium]|nr:cytochrome P460 family protein [Acidobacteriota bacterium]
MHKSLKLAAVFGFLILLLAFQFIRSRTVSATIEPLEKLLVEMPQPTADVLAQSPCPEAKPSPLPLPSSLPPNQQGAVFEQQVFQYLDSGGYLSWCKDKWVRDTGPYLNNTYYGTHPAVRIYYSPEIIAWLTGDQSKPIPDGAMIIKEQYTPPAARYQEMTEAELAKAFAKSKDWTIMIKDAKGAKDGWYWGEFYTGMTYDNNAYPFNYPTAGFGEYCLRCHASADKELTFAALNNIQGFPGQPLTFRVDNSWRNLPPGLKPIDYTHRRPPQKPTPKPPVDANAEFLSIFKTISRVPYREVLKMPAETLDRVVAGQKGAEQFISSDQCQTCHSAATGPFGPTMFIQTGVPFGNIPAGINVSPYGEWRWSPMGLAGRDPIFYAQLDSEIAILKNEFKDPEPIIRATINTCMSCHGGMGKRQFDIDHNDPFADFKLDFVYLTDPNDKNFKYGALARDGISCTMCHHIKEDDYPPNQAPIAYFLENSTTGQFQMGKPDELYGPFEDKTITTLPMENSLGIKPKHSAYIKSSRLCGSCHSINLPNVDDPLKPGDKPTVLDTSEKNPVFKPFKHSIEQATYLEWLNSQFQTEFAPNKTTAQSCQDCHMPGGYENKAKNLNIPQIRQPIATIEDTTYPAADHRAPLDKIFVRFRETGFVRHELLGLNVPLLEMFNQFNDILGVRKSDYMSGSVTDLPDTIANFVQQAQEKSATIAIPSVSISNDKLTASVKVANLTGHRLPSGVGFRRAFIEFLVIVNQDGREQVVWSSGRTNKEGVIINGNGEILPSEFFAEYRDGKQIKQYFQPHYETITSQNQVQIYEELLQDAKGKFTTSFIHRDIEVKDNRLLPQGWTKKGPSDAIPHAYIEATHPKGNAAQDPNYQDGSGTDVVTYEVALPKGIDAKTVTVQATLYYQSIPPYFLNMRFQTAPQSAATKRLYFLTSNLMVGDTPIKDWKLKLVSTSAQVKQ